MSLGKLEALADEAARERRTYLAKEPDPEPSRTPARLHTDISTLGRILTEPLPEAVHQSLTEPWSRVARAAAQVLRQTSLALPARRSPPALDPVNEAIAAYEAAVDNIRRTGITKDLPNEAVGARVRARFRPGTIPAQSQGPSQSNERAQSAET